MSVWRTDFPGFEHALLLVQVTALTALALTAVDSHAKFLLPQMPALPFLSSLSLTQCRLPTGSMAAHCCVGQSLCELTALTQLHLSASEDFVRLLPEWPCPQLVKLTVGCERDEATELATIVQTRCDALLAGMPALR